LEIQIANNSSANQSFCFSILYYQEIEEKEKRKRREEKRRRGEEEKRRRGEEEKRRREENTKL